jgi:glycosyltransferase involved in cell wall biosynthesis
MTGFVTIDVAGAQMGGAARFVAELRGYLARTGREDVQVIGAARRVDPAWLIRRELARPGARRRIALNNVSFVAPGGERWTLLRNALHFLTDTEASSHLGSSLRASVRREATVVRLSARRADALVVPSTAMAERVTRILPGVRNRLTVRPHPVSADSIPRRPRDSTILCPVLFAPYKRMDEHLAELLAAIDDQNPPIRVRVTALPEDLPAFIAAHPKLDFIGRLDGPRMREQWARSRAIYFPTGLESFGYPLAEARVHGQPIIARDTAQNREIAGSALCGFAPGDPGSLRGAVTSALAKQVSPDPTPFDPDSYFGWILGRPQ